MIKDSLGHAANVNATEGGSANDFDQKYVIELLCGNALLKAGLAQLLSGTCFEVLGANPNGASSSLGHPHRAPVLVVVDITGSSEQGLEFIRNAKSRYPEARLVALANQLDGQFVQSAVVAGVDSFCLATSTREVLIKTLEITMLGENILPGALVHSLFDQASMPSSTAQIIPLAEHHSSDSRVQKLSPRETVILQSLMGGDPNKVIARKLDITEATIKVHVKAILRKIGVANRTQAAMWATGNLREPAPSAGEFHEVRRLS